MDPAKAVKLIDILTRQHAAHQELRAALAEQQQALRRFDAAGLELLRQRGDRLAERIGELEAARAALTGGGARLTELAAALGEPQRSRLLAVAHGLRTVAEETAALGRINRAAAQCMLNHFHGVYRLLARAGRPVSYGASGRPQEGGGAALLVDAVA